MRGKLPLITLALALLSLLALNSSTLSKSLIYNREAIFNLEFWRLISGHFVHFSWLHYFYDVLVFLVAGSILERHKPLFIAPLVFVLGLAISITLIFLKPNMLYYGGLSAIACGMLFYLAMWWLLYRPKLKWPSVIMILTLTVKTLHEISSQDVVLPYPDERFHQPVPESHMIAIFFAFFLFLICERKALKSSSSKQMGSEDKKA